MFRVICERIKQKYRTIRYPAVEPVLPDLFRGLPRILSCSGSDCCACVTVCPTQAIAHREGKFTIDLGKCIFCGRCQKACSRHCITFSRDWRLAARRRGDLSVSDGEYKKAAALDKAMLRLFGRSLRLRQVSCGGCNACELDTNVLNTVVFDLQRFGIQFVASPRHADGILVTGPVTKNMLLALQKTWDAVPVPRIVIACGACAISGGLYRDTGHTHNGVDSIMPVDLYIPGCPPHPVTILDGLLRLLGKL